jgi:hypothetical protein
LCFQVGDKKLEIFLLKGNSGILKICVMASHQKLSIILVIM